MHRDENFTILLCRFSLNLEASDFRSSKGLSGSVGACNGVGLKEMEWA